MTLKGLLITLVFMGGTRTATGLLAGAPATGGANVSRRHGTQVRACISPAGKLLAFVQHWHSSLSEPSHAGTMTLSDSSGNQITRQADFMLPDTSVSYLDSLCANGFSTSVISTCPGYDGYDDWAVFEFTLGACSTSSSFTLLIGHTMVLMEGCSNLYPATVSGSVACPTTNSPTPNPTPSPTPSPTSSSRPPPPPAGAAGGQAQAKGDPHLANVFGQRFDLRKEGWHTLVRVPRGAKRAAALLSVDAEARQMGVACADMYFQSVNLTGRWVGSKGRAFSAGHVAEKESGRWLRFGQVELKVVQGHTKSGIVYLNLFVRNLKFAGYPVGGILGLDDHTAAAEPSLNCQNRISLLSLDGLGLGASPKNASTAVAYF